MTIKVYTTDRCPQCKVLKSYLQVMNIDFEEINVNTPELIEKVVNLTGQRTIPVIQSDNEIIVGFNPDKIKSLIS
jgi:glutaredoxin